MKIKKVLNDYLYENEFYTRKSFINSLQKIINKLPESVKTFKHDLQITFSLTTQEMNVNHSKFPELFGVTRELFAIEYIPNFKNEVGIDYLLKTRNASYFYLKDFHFGDKMTIKMALTELTDVSYNLVAGFFCGEELRTVGFQKIVYTDMEGKPIRMPKNLKHMLSLNEMNC